MILIHYEKAALGPTASLTVALLLLVFAVILMIFRVRLPWLYSLTTLIIILGALSAILPAFQQSPSLWPADFWRYAGVTLNSIGVFGGVWGLFNVSSVKMNTD